MNHRSKRVLVWSACVVLALFLFWKYFEVKTEVRWLLSSRRYKSAVSSQPAPQNGQLKHIEWDSWGARRGQDTTVYLVLRPATKVGSNGSLRLMFFESGPHVFPPLPFVRYRPYDRECPV